MTDNEALQHIQDLLNYCFETFPDSFFPLYDLGKAAEALDHIREGKE